MKMASVNALRSGSSIHCAIHRTDPHVDSKKCIWEYIKFELNLFNAHRLLSDCVHGM